MLALGKRAPQSTTRREDVSKFHRAGVRGKDDGDGPQDGMRIGWKTEDAQLKEGGGTFDCGIGGMLLAAALESQWHSPAYRLYRDLGAKRTAAMASALVEASDDLAEPGQPCVDRIPEDCCLCPYRYGAVWGCFGSRFSLSPYRFGFRLGVAVAPEAKRFRIYVKSWKCGRNLKGI